MAVNVADIETIKDISELNFGEHAGLLQSLQKQAEETPETTSSLLPKFYRLLEGKGTSSDMLPVAAKTFASISKSLSQPQIAEALNAFHNQNRDNFIERGASSFCMSNPVCAVPVFNYIASQVEKTPYSDDKKNFFMPAAHNMTTALLCAADEELPAMMKKINSFEPEIQNLFVSSYGKLYAKKSCLRDDIWGKLLKEAQNTSKFNRLYENLGVIIAADSEKIPECLHIISSKITDTNHDTIDLKKAYEVLGKIRSIYPHKEKVDAIFMRGLQNPKNSMSSKKAAYRQMGRIDELTSRSSIGKRVEKTDDNQYGFKSVDHITDNEPAVLFLGGNATNSDRSANGYLSSLEKLLQYHKIEENIALYAAIYDFGEFDDKAIAFNDNLARTKLMQDHHRSVKLNKQLNEDTLHPRYVDDLFDKALLNRISDKNGKRLSTDEACAKIRKLTIVAHCHGAYTFLKLEEKMQKKMQELGYSAEERAKIQHEMLCVAHAPYAPLGVSKSTMISFASAQDLEINHHNNFETEIRAMSKNNEVMLSYFPGKQGELFLTPSMGEDVEEHNFLGYLPENQGLSKEGLAIMALSGNTIVNGVKNSLSGEPLPPVKDLVCGTDEKYQKLFDKLKDNGEKMWQKMSLNTAIRLKAITEYNKLHKGQSDG